MSIYILQTCVIVGLFFRFDSFCHFKLLKKLFEILFEFFLSFLHFEQIESLFELYDIFFWLRNSIEWFNFLFKSFSLLDQGLIILILFLLDLYLKLLIVFVSIKEVSMMLIIKFGEVLRNQLHAVV